ncbi:annexin A3a [Paramormyrops kingsleyae]|uniref:annexin A3a n=1 Tax=Paramormyrops kingsleyae TaxID=1676925 RepID=UPI003B96CBB0
MASTWNDLDLLLDSPTKPAATSAQRGTIIDKTNFNASEDAAALRKAIEGLGTDEKTIITILTGRTNKQRQLICAAYHQATGRTLKEDLKGDTHGDFEDLLVALITPANVFDSQEVIQAMKGLGTTDNTLIEIFASRTTQQVKTLSDAYLAETGKKVTLDLKTEVSGDYGQALLTLAEATREDSAAVDMGKARQEAKVLYEAGEKRWGTDENKFIDILCHRSLAQLRQVLIEYKNISGKTLQESIESEMSGHLEDLLVAIVKCVKSVPAYMAERLHTCMKGLGTADSTLRRIMVSRSEIDMLDIKAEFKKMYGYSLHSALESETSGEYRKTLLKICGGE